MKSKTSHGILIFIYFTFLFFLTASPVAAGPISFCSGGWDCAFFGIGVLINQFIWLAFLIAGAFVLVKALRKKDKSLGILVVILFGLGVLASPTAQHKIDNMNLKTTYVEEYKKQPGLLNSLDFEIYFPSYLPPNISLSDWEVLEKKGIKDLVIKFGNNNGFSREFSHIHGFNLTMYKDDGIFVPPQCGLENHQQIGSGMKHLENYNCRLLLTTPSGIKVYREEFAGPYSPGVTPRVLSTTQLSQDRIFFKKGSMIFTSQISTSEKSDLSFFNMSEFIKMIDSLEEITPEKLLEMRSVEDKIKDINL